MVHVEDVGLNGGVTQAIDGSRRASFRKRIVQIAVEGGQLGAVWKRQTRPRRRRGAVILLHGFAQNRYSWHLSERSLPCYLATRGYDVINLDLRGAGRSRQWTRGYSSVAQQVRRDLPRVVGAVKELTGETEVHLVGHSLGGFMACGLAGQLPGRIRSVVSLAGLYGFGSRNTALRIGVALFSGSVRRGWLRGSERLPTNWLSHLAGRLPLRMLDHPWVGRLNPLQAWYPGSMEPELLAEWLSRSFEGARTGTVEFIMQMAQRESADTRRLRREFERSGVPLLAVAAAQDRLIAPDDARQAVERTRGDRLFHLFGAGADEPGWGHMDLVLGWRAPRRVWPLLADWLDRH